MLLERKYCIYFYLILIVKWTSNFKLNANMCPSIFKWPTMMGGPLVVVLHPGRDTSNRFVYRAGGWALISHIFVSSVSGRTINSRIYVLGG